MKFKRSTIPIPLLDMLIDLDLKKAQKWLKNSFLKMVQF